MTNVYGVSVTFDVLLDRKDEEEVAEEFPDASTVEIIGQRKLLVEYGVCADYPAEAYRNAANLVEAKIAVSNVGPVNVVQGKVFGDDLDEEVLFE